MNPWTAADHLGWHASGTHGVVAGGGAPAVAAGLDLLAAGGNAADAVAASILAHNVTDHYLCSIGGEVPTMVYDATHGEVKVLCGVGRAPRDPAAIAWYLAHGIPAGDDIRMAPVPAVVDLLTTLLQRYGTQSFARIMAPAVALLGAGGEPWHPRLAHTLLRLADEEAHTPGDRVTKLQAVSDCFYGRGPARHAIAEELTSYYRERGSFLTRSDFAAHHTPVEDAVTAEYRGATICKCGPWTQGPFLLQSLRLLAGDDVRASGHLSAATIHLAAEAMKLALADRDAYYADPDFAAVPLAALLSDAYTTLRRPLIDPRAASRVARPGDPWGMHALARPAAFARPPGGTTTLVVADRWGNVIAATPSANVPAGLTDGGAAGVTFSNRLRSLNTNPGHPNCIAAGKRPRVTLTPTLVLRGGRPLLAISVAGADLQDQCTLNLLLNTLDFGLDPAAAVSAPRFATAHHEDSFDPRPDRAAAFLRPASLLLNEAIPAAVQAELAARGHELELTAHPIARPVLLAFDPATGLATAAGDPQAGRHAGAV